MDEWSKAVFDKLTSLKCLNCWGMEDRIKRVDDTTFDERTSTLEERILWKEGSDEGTFPDATMNEEDACKETQRSNTFRKYDH